MLIKGLRDPGLNGFGRAGNFGIVRRRSLGLRRSRVQATALIEKLHQFL